MCPNSTPATSNASNSACPSINDTTPTPGDVINVADRGTWTGTAVLAYEYQWQRCTSSAENTCSDMEGEDEITYVVRETDTGDRFRAIVTVTNPAPTFGLFRRRTPVTSATAAAPASMPGYNQTNIPAMSPPGSIAVGTTLTAFGTLPAGDGYFNPAATVRTWEWLRCTSSTDESTCTKIGGAGGAEPGGKSYTLKTADGTAHMRVRVRGSASGLSNELLSAATNPVISEPATPTKNPAVFGDPYPGETLGSSVGAWKDPSTGFVRRWLQCDADGSACTQIAKVATTDPENGPTYTVRAGDLGKAIRLRVIADVNGDSDNEQDNVLPHDVEVETPAMLIVPRPAPPGGGAPAGGTPGGSGVPGGGLPGGGLPGGGVGATGGPLPDRVKPVLSALALSRTKFVLAKGKTAATARTGKGTSFRFRLSELASLTVRITKPSAGRKVGRSCRKATRKLRKKPRCTYQRPMMVLRRRSLPAGTAAWPSPVASARSPCVRAATGRRWWPATPRGTPRRRARSPSGSCAARTPRRVGLRRSGSGVSGSGGASSAPSGNTQRSGATAREASRSLTRSAYSPAPLAVAAYSGSPPARTSHASMSETLEPSATSVARSTVKPPLLRRRAIRRTRMRIWSSSMRRP